MFDKMTNLATKSSSRDNGLVTRLVILSKVSTDITTLDYQGGKTTLQELVTNTPFLIDPQFHLFYYVDYKCNKPDRIKFKIIPKIFEEDYTMV